MHISDDMLYQNHKNAGNYSAGYSASVEEVWIIDCSTDAAWPVVFPARFVCVSNFQHAVFLLKTIQVIMYHLRPSETLLASGRTMREIFLTYGGWNICKLTWSSICFLLESVAASAVSSSIPILTDVITSTVLIQARIRT